MKRRVSLTMLMVVALLCLVFSMSACDFSSSSSSNGGDTEQSTPIGDETTTPVGDDNNETPSAHTHTLQHNEAVSATCTEILSIGIAPAVTDTFPMKPHQLKSLILLP